MGRGVLDIAAGALPCDAWHHYYHYQSSAQYLWLAETLSAMGREAEALKAYERAIFQDHFNAEALAGKGRGVREARAPKYDKHPVFDLEFLSLIGQLPDDATKPHDEAARALLAKDIAGALALLDKAIAAAPLHSNSHFTRGKCFFYERRFDEAATSFTEAIRLSHIKHDGYHRAASAEHLARGGEFFKQGKLDLAVNDFTKALDLHRGNKEALKARAEAYRAKGNVPLAEEDELKLIS
jgi:tetratricopeptide (TPR) repeat protein